MCAYYNIRELYYITHIDNIPSILERGILSHEKIISENIHFTPIYDNEIVIRRSNKLTPSGQDLWSYANLFFQPRNPMLYRVILEKDISNLAIIGVSKGIMDLPGVYVTNGNAANNSTEIKSVKEFNKVFKEIKKDLNKEFWTESDGSKRRIMSECLVPNYVPSEFINCVYTADFKMAEKVKQIIGNKINVVHNPYTFFQPSEEYKITSNLSLFVGDMFFSRCQTITISVNLVGIMGKGIASRAKYQFPDVYVHYQDVCRNKKLKMGKPYLFKREISYDSELADEPYTLSNANHTTWFLLFATKNHWRNDADIKGIEEGLRWILKSSQDEGITSIALPALGCGLGNLTWDKVGPLMCKYLSQLNIPVHIYLPLEKEIPQQYLTVDFLINSNLL